MQQYSAGPLTGVLKPRYRVISALLGESFDPSKGVDVFIDLNTLVSTLASSKKWQTSLPFGEGIEQDIISSVLMILKHWKDFCRKWEDVRFFYIVNDFHVALMPEQETLKTYMIPYVNKFELDRFKQMVYYWEESMKRIEKILDYIPKSYFIRCDRFDAFIVPNIMDDYEKSGRKRIIVSGNSLMTNYHYMPNTHIIYSRYKHDGMSQVSDPLMIIQSVTKIDDEIVGTFAKNKVFYNLLNAIVGDSDRGIMGLTQMGITKFATTLLRAVEKREIHEDPKTYEAVLSVIDPMYHDYIKQVYPLIDIESHTNMIKKSSIEKMKSKMIDLYDIDSLRTLSVNGLTLLELL
jgi:hypothetical protein